MLLLSHEYWYEYEYERSCQPLLHSQWLPSCTFTKEQSYRHLVMYPKHKLAVPEVNMAILACKQTHRLSFKHYKHAQLERDKCHHLDTVSSLRLKYILARQKHCVSVSDQMLGHI